VSTLALSWSGGKDSALALRALRAAGRAPSLLLTTVTEEYERVSMHGVRVDLLRAQAAAVGLPLVEIRIPPACVNDVYEAQMAQAFADPPLRDVDDVAFGDLFLEDVRAYRETQVLRFGKRALFPLWGRDTASLAREFVDAGFEAFVVCVDPTFLDPSFAGRAYDEDFLARLPASVDPCGENGEFHTFVHAGPVFAEPVEVRVGKVVARGGYAFCDLYAAATQPGSGRDNRPVSTSSSTRSSSQYHGHGNHRVSSRSGATTAARTAATSSSSSPPSSEASSTT
jgi:uncharacterized protein (TIGR00290 family)